MKFSLKKQIKMSTNSTVVKESGKMYIAQGMGMVFAGLIIITTGKFLTIAEVGLINYIVVMISLTSAFFNFGLDNTSARVVLQERTKEGKRIVTGTALLLSIILAGIYGIFLILINLSVPLWGRIDIQPLVYLILPFAGYNIILITYKQICYANGSIREASVQLCISYIIYWFFLLLAHFLGFLSLKVALISSFAINMLATAVPIIIWHAGELRLNRYATDKLWIEQKARGWKIYLSRVFFSSSFNLDTMILGAFHPLDSVAHYSIAKYMAMPVSLVGTSVSQSTYRQYSKANKISQKLIMRVAMFTAVMACIMFIAGVVVVMILGESYDGMLKILPLTILYSVINGVNALYNSFMNAKGLAEELKRLAIISAVANLVFNFSLIIPFGAMGGCVASLLVVSIMLAFRIYYCRKYEKDHDVAGKV